MTREEFISKIAPLVCKYAKQYNILCPSAVISQAVLESDGGTSELAVNAHNYFGLKYRSNRCPSASGIYYKIGSEQNPDGSYTSSAMQWMKFSTLEDGIKGYYDFTTHQDTLFIFIGVVNTSLLVDFLSPRITRIFTYLFIFPEITPNSQLLTPN